MSSDAAAAAEAKKLTLKSSDGEISEVEEAVAMESQTIRNLIEEDCTAGDIPLPNVTGRILAKVIEFYKKHVESTARKADDGRDRAADEELKAWDAEFVKVDQATLFDLILTEVNFLGQLRHPNLVKLVGYCCEDDHRLLVYEFLFRGSLENHLFRKTAAALSWLTRMMIALGAAKGLTFLHNVERPIIYRDFKTSNILLDSVSTEKKLKE